MRTASVMVALMMASGCATNRWEYRYAIEPTPVEHLEGVEVRAALGKEGVDLIVSNTSEETARLLWDRASIVDPFGRPHAVMLSGQKMITAGEALPPTVVPPGSTMRVSVYPADAVRFIAAGRYSKWHTEPLLIDWSPDGPKAADSIVAAYGGKSVRLSVYVEHPSVNRAIEAKFTIAAASRVFCRQSGCVDAGSVYPTMTSVPKL